jgi:2-dehydropantoate 2-reductase
MRVIVYGAGAVGSVVGGRLHQAGIDTVLVGRPAHVAAIEADGLRLRDGHGTDIIRVAAVTSLDELPPLDDDVVLITAKTQDTGAIHDAIERWNAGAAIVCGTNGVEHERTALRRFERVYGMVVQMPAGFERPGDVVALCSPVNALLDVGRYPYGIDDTAIALTAALESTGRIAAEADADVMVKKYGKLLLNLGNVGDAACGPAGRFAPVCKAAMAEARTVFAAAGIAFDIADEAERERYTQRLKSAITFNVPEGETFLGGSTWQSLAKGASSVETDYFNGEIVLLGRLHAVPTPHNRFLQELAHTLLHAHAEPQSMGQDELDARWRAAVEPVAALA